MLDAGEARWGPLEGPEAGHGRLVIRWAPDQDPWETLHGLNIVVAPSSGDETAVESTAPSIAIDAWLAADGADGVDAGPAGWLLGKFEPWGANESLEAGPHVLPWEELAAALAAGGTWWIGEPPAAANGAEHATGEGHGPEGHPGEEGHGDHGHPGGELPVEGDPGGGITTMDYGGYGGGGYGGGGYGGGGYGGNQPPVAVADLAYSGKIGQPLTIYVLQNDSDPDGPRPTVTSVTQPAHGAAQVALEGGAVTYTAPPSAFQSDSFEYTVADSYGAMASATVSVTLVEAGGYTVEWLDPDDAWAGLTEDWCDVEDELRWTAEPLPTGLPTVSRIDFVKKPWDEREDPMVPWQDFATNESGDGPAFGNPGLGEWAVMPEVHFYSDVVPSQSSFCAMAAAPGKKGALSIDRVEWQEHTANPEQAGELVPGSGLRFFPDAQEPGEQMRKKVDVVVHVLPQNRPGIVVDLRWFDVDDPSSDVAPLDEDPPANELNNFDNIQTGLNADAFLSSQTVPIGANGVGRAVFQIDSVQPGNNYRIGASVRRTSGPVPRYLDRVCPLARDEDSMFYDRAPLNFKYDGPARQEAIFQTRFKSVCMSPVLTVWRKLHVEADSMGEVVENFYSRVNVRTAPPVGGTSELSLDWPLPAGDEMRFENGKLTDGHLRQFVIVSNGLNSVVVLNWPDGTAPEEGGIILQDDDAQVMPEMPNTNLMQEAFGRAFIDPVFDGGGDLANNTSDVPFFPNVNTLPQLTQQINAGLNSHANRTEAFWVAYVQSAYQGPTGRDNDPSTEVSERPGECLPSPHRGAILYLETLRDAAAEVGYTTPNQLALLKQRLVVHEIAHEFGPGLEDNPPSPPSIMHYGPFWELHNPDGSKFNDHQLRALRERELSPGS